jgi:hypothetical protein
VTTSSVSRVEMSFADRMRHYWRALIIAAGVSLGQVGPEDFSRHRAPHAIVRLVPAEDTGFSAKERIGSLVLTTEFKASDPSRMPPDTHSLN